MRLPLALLALILALSLAGAAQALPYKGQTFDTEQKASWECRGGEVVWVDLPSGRWFRKGDGRYGDTEGGAYACRREVEGTPRPPPAIPSAPPPLVPSPSDDE